MAKTETATEEVVAPVAEVPKLSLDEFCARLSETVKSPELIGAFHYSERAAGSPHATSEAFKARFEAFRNAPV